MALVFTNKIGEGSASTGLTSFTSVGTYTPTTNALQLASFSLRGSITADPTVTGCGLTWVLVSRVQSFANPARTLCTYRALGTGSLGAITITRAGADTIDHPVVSVTEVTGVTTSGTNGSGAVSQVATDADQSTATPTVSITVNSAANGLYAAFGAYGNNPTSTPGTGYTELMDQLGSTDCALTTECRTTTDTNADITWSSSSVCAGMVLEIVPVVGPTIDTQPTAGTVTINNSATTSKTFTSAATTSGGTLVKRGQFEDSVASDTYTDITEGGIWANVSTDSVTVTPTTKTGITGRRFRHRYTDDNGTTYTNAVMLTVYTGFQFTSSTTAVTNGSGQATVTWTDDRTGAALGNGGFVKHIATSGSAVSRSSARPT